MRALLFTALILLTAIAAQARTWNVPADAPTVQAGIDSAAVGDVVAIAAGVYAETGLAMKAGITLRGAGGDPAAVVLDGAGDAQPPTRILTFGPAEQTPPTLIESLTFADSPGGALSCVQIDSVVIADCVFAGNSVDGSGGGLHVNQIRGPVLVRDCRFSDNRATEYGGAVYLYQIENARIERSLFVRNHADTYGAAVSAGYVNGIAEIDQCTFTGHTGGATSAAMFLVGYAEIALTRSIVARNHVRFATTGPAHLGYVWWTCNDLFENAGDDYTTWTFANGNFSADPCFCDADADDYRLAADSWCLAGRHPWGCDDLVGASGAGCEATGCDGPVGQEKQSLSSFKSLFR